MKAKDLLAEPVIVGNTVCLATLGNNEILFVGSSIPANFDPNSGYLDSICFFMPPERARAVAAIAVIQNDGKGREVFTGRYFLVLKRRENGEIESDFCACVFCEEGILPSIIKDGNVCHLGFKSIKGEFTSSRHRKNANFFIPDPDDICRFLVGDISLEQLKGVAEEVAAEESARAQLADLQAKLNGCQAYISQVEGELKKARDTGSSDVFELTNMLTKAFSEAEKNRNIFKEIAGKATEIEVAANTLFSSKKEIARIAREILILVTPRPARNFEP